MWLLNEFLIRIVIKIFMAYVSRLVPVCVIFKKAPADKTDSTTLECSKVCEFKVLPGLVVRVIGLLKAKSLRDDFLGFFSFKKLKIALVRKIFWVIP